MLLRRITDFILAGRLQAMAVAFLWAYVPLVGMLSIVIAALVTLRKGVFEGALVTAAATAPMVISYLAYPDVQIDSVNVSNVILGLILGNILIWVLAVILREYLSWSLVLQVMGLVSLACVGAVHLLNPDIQGWWATKLTAYFMQSQAILDKLQGQPTPPDVFVANLVGLMKAYATGMIVMLVTFHSVIQLVVARWWQAALFNPGGLKKELYQIRMSYVAAAVFVLGLGLSALGNETAVDMMPILYGIFGLAGLSVIHYGAQFIKSGWIVLSLIYLIIMIIPGTIPLVAMIALLDAVIDLRKHLQKKMGL